MRLKSGSLFILLVFGTLLLFSCKKEKLLSSGGELRFSTDTLTFDTVFTEAGSFTLGLKIFNPQNQKINISSIRLEKGDSSFFRLNVNGVPGNAINNIELAANDSIYVFATVKIDPRNQSNPFLITDKLIATLNGNEYSVPFMAYGQDAYYVVGQIIGQNTTWHTDKPYVVLHSALVEKGATLTIPAGCRIYMNADSRLYVYGRLLVNGTKEDSVIFQGNRLDRGYFGYEDYPGEWGGIYFDTASTGNVMKWAILKNCGNNTMGFEPFGVMVAGYPGISTQLEMYNTIIANSIGFGLLSVGGNIKAENCMVHSTGTQAFAAFQGGNYRFTNCNFVNYQPSKLSHTDEPTVALLNYRDISNTQYVQGDLSARFTNCLIFGSMEDELLCLRKGTALYEAGFDHCLIKRTKPLDTDMVNSGAIQLTETILTTDRESPFMDHKKWNFRPKEGAPMINKGTAVPGISNDLDDKPWIAADTFDIGAYKYP